MSQDTDARRAIRELLRGVLKKEARTFRKLKGGRNSQVFRVDCADGSTFAAKAYFQSADDSRDRAGVEFSALQFLKNEGVQQTAGCVAFDAARRIGIYEYIHGRPVSDPGEAEIDQAVKFLLALKHIPDAGKAAHFPPASEACFSIGAILRNLETRFVRLEQAAADHPDLAEFLQKEAGPFRPVAEAWCRAVCQEHGIDLEAEIPAAERTLSPSDFGFHNALRREDGSLVFVDFEYFGWDDPAKTLVDFVLHPAMRLSRALKERFLAGALFSFGAVSLRERIRAVYPLFGLKWCAILLNEFAVENLARRCFADDTSGAWDRAAQIEKARRMLAGVMHDYREFPQHA